METQSLLEENIFMDYLARKRLVLAVSNDPNLGYRIPETEEIQSSGTNLFQYYLFNDVDIASMNELERRVGNLLDRQSSILWWFKNKVKRDGYSIQGWRSNRVYPDFVAAKKDANDKLDIVYIFESKGEHLQGNADTEYKKKVLDIMTDQHRQDAIQMYTQPELPLFKVNDRVECYLIEEGREEHEIRKLFAPTAVQAPVKPAVVGRRRKALKRTMSGRKRKPAG
jgi:type III restriction enzyme